ncbi:MAG: ribose-5-phosphate isomerase RpiA [Alphaproteobacteria bacterium]|nr:MAG: ribose-5-phosphate isomerase RpiA [Alphaproteobacteria bacterium]
MDADSQKHAAARRALDYVRPGMKLGLGTGSTAAKFVALLGERVAAGLEVVCVPTSTATAQQAEALGIALTTLEVEPELDLTVDGADELDDQLRLIKGGGGALLREKIVAASSARMVVIADASKHVATLGAFPLPVEILPFGWKSTRLRVGRAASACGCTGDIVLRQAGSEPFITDNGNYILDCAFGRITAPEKLALALAQIPGVVETGLFLGLADAAIVAGPAGVAIIGESP